MKNEVMLLWFEAPLQAWGYDSRFYRRDTLPFPTKSGVYGLLLSAMGRSGAEEVLLEELSNCEQEIISYKPNKQSTDDECVSPFLMDFQMVGSGYDKKDGWEKMLIPKQADGGSAEGGGTKLTYRYYIQDARFAVIQEVPELHGDEIKNALINPVFDIYLGRKNCPPSDFVFRGIFQNKEAAITIAEEIASEKKLIRDFVVIEGEHENGEPWTLNDIPLQFGERKKYRDRTVTLIKTDG